MSKFHIWQRVCYHTEFFGDEYGEVIQIINAPEPYGTLYNVCFEKKNIGSLGGNVHQYAESQLEEA
jgi:hypothetical protein